MRYLGFTFVCSVGTMFSEDLSKTDSMVLFIFGRRDRELSCSKDICKYFTGVMS